MKSTLVIILLLFSLYSCQKSVKYSYPKVELENYPDCQDYDIAPNSEYCECVQENQLSFPTKNVEYGRLMVNSAELGEPFQFNDKKYPLDEHFISTFRDIVSDSSNFHWGELGTQYTCFIIEFLDSSHKLINRANITCGGMMTLEPSFGVTKWGRMNDEAHSLVFDLISTYERM